MGVGCIAVVKRRGKDTVIDNSWIVPHNPLISKMFNAHINVEYCHSVKSIKCVLKYVHKGNDMAIFGLTAKQSNDEITQFQILVAMKLFGEFLVSTFTSDIQLLYTQMSIQKMVNEFITRQKMQKKEQQIRKIQL